MTYMVIRDKEYGVSDARKHFSNIVREVSEMGIRVAITNHGVAQAVLISAEEWESVAETLETIGDSSLMEGIRAFLKDGASPDTNTRDLSDVILDIFSQDDGSEDEG